MDKLVKWNFQIRKDQLDKIRKMQKPGLSQSAIAREALDEYFNRKEEQK
jgi:hypothetical protein